MKCLICKIGETHPGLATVTVERNGTIVVIKQAPASLCDNCAEYYLDEPTAERVYSQTDNAVQRHVEVEILQYAA
jgi:YgiT-type zinc finger domain-containing protein